MVGRRASAIAVGVALFAGSGPAAAQYALVPQLRLQGGYITEARPEPIGRVSGVFVSAIPQATLLWGQRNTLYSLNYALTGSLNTIGGASEIANRLTLAVAHDFTGNTALLLTATGAYSTLSNLFVLDPAATTNTGLAPGFSTKVVTASAREALRHNLTSRLVLNQTADATFFTTLPDAPPIDTFFTGFGLGIDYLWRRDSIGFDTRAVYTTIRTAPPLLVQKLITVNAGPTWRHDWSRSISTFFTAGAGILFSPDGDTETLATPNVLGNVLYTFDNSSVGLTAGSGFLASPLTGQMTRTHRIVLNGTVPLSLRRNVFLGTSVGYFRSTLIDIQNNAPDFDFDSVFTDIDLSWQVTPIMQVFARHQFLAQIADVDPLGVNPSFLRDAVFVGVNLTPFGNGSIGGGGGGGGFGPVPTRFPQRVDGADGRSSAEDERGRDPLAPRDSDGNEERRDDGGIVVPQPLPPQQQPQPRQPGAQQPQPAAGSRWITVTPARPPTEE